MPNSQSSVLKVHLFASLRELAGWHERSLILADLDQPTALAVWEELQLGPWFPGLRIAINWQFAQPEQKLVAGDELAFLPPFTGG